jgi:hypothetical protein
MKKELINKLFITVTILIVSLSLTSQTSGLIQIKIDSLRIYKTNLLNKLKVIDAELDNLMILKNEFWIKEQSLQVYVFHKDGHLYDKEGRNTEVMEVKKGTKVLLVKDLDKYFFVVSYNGSVFTAPKRWLISEKEKWISDSTNISMKISIKNMTKEEDSIANLIADTYVFIMQGGLYDSSNDWDPSIIVEKGTEVIFVKDIIITGYPSCRIIYNGEPFYADKSILVSAKDYEDKIRREELHRLEKVKRDQGIIDKYGEDVARRIFDHNIWIGMTSGMLKLSLLPPQDINRTITSGLIREQWVYKNIIIYLENDIVVAWQD